MFGGQIKALEIEPGMLGGAWIFNPYRMPECDDRKNSLTKTSGDVAVWGHAGGLIQISDVNMNCLIRPKAAFERRYS